MEIGWAIRPTPQDFNCPEPATFAPQLLPRFEATPALLPLCPAKRASLPLPPQRDWKTGTATPLTADAIAAAIRGSESVMRDRWVNLSISID